MGVFLALPAKSRSAPARGRGLRVRGGGYCFRRSPTVAASHDPVNPYRRTARRTSQVRRLSDYSGPSLHWWSQTIRTSPAGAGHLHHPVRRGQSVHWQGSRVACISEDTCLWPSWSTPGDRLLGHCNLTDYYRVRILTGSRGRSPGNLPLGIGEHLAPSGGFPAETPAATVDI